jgi:hypothetical protein
MVTNDPVKNREFVKKSQQKKKEQIGIEEFNRIHNEKQATYRRNLINQKGIEEVRREKAEYMRQYRLKQKQEKQKNEAIIKIQSAIRNKKAINEFTKKYVDKNTSIVQNKAITIQNAFRVYKAKKEFAEKDVKNKLKDAIDKLLKTKATTIQSNYRMKLARQKTFEKIADGFLMPTF